MREKNNEGKRGEEEKREHFGRIGLIHIPHQGQSPLSVIFYSKKILCSEATEEQFPSSQAKAKESKEREREGSYLYLNPELIHQVSLFHGQSLYAEETCYTAMPQPLWAHSLIHVKSIRKRIVLWWLPGQGSGSVLQLKEPCHWVKALKWQIRIKNAE